MNKGNWELDDLNYYISLLELHGISLFTSQSHPYPSGFVQTQLPVIHNYPLFLAINGLMCEESYVAGYNLLKRVENPAKRFSETKTYVYPAIIERFYYKKILMSLSETDYILYKPQTRACVPIMTHHNVLAPGSRAKTVIISVNDLPKEFYIRFGVKRFGIWKVTLKKVKAEVVNGLLDINYPFNVLDVKNVVKYVPILKHYAGDVAIFGKVNGALKLEEILIPIPNFI